MMDASGSISKEGSHCFIEIHSQEMHSNLNVFLPFPLLIKQMGQQPPSASKSPVQWIKPLPGWYGTNIHAKGKVAVYSEATHAIYSVNYTANMTVRDFKVSVCRLMHRPPTLTLRLYMGDQLLSDIDSLDVLTPESLLRLEFLSEDSTSDTFVSEGEDCRRSPQTRSKTEVPKSASVDASREDYFSRVPLKTDLSDLAVPDLELKAGKPKRRK